MIYVLSFSVFNSIELNLKSLTSNSAFNSSLVITVPKEDS